MIYEIFPGNAIFDAPPMNPSGCVCGCLCTTTDPQKDDKQEDYDREGD
jgi:hypothetical protein